MPFYDQLNYSQSLVALRDKLTRLNVAYKGEIPLSKPVTHAAYSDLGTLLSLLEKDKPEAPIEMIESTLRDIIQKGEKGDKDILFVKEQPFITRLKEIYREIPSAEQVKLKKQQEENKQQQKTQDIGQVYESKMDTIKVQWEQEKKQELQTYYEKGKADFFQELLLRAREQGLLNIPEVKKLLGWEENVTGKTPQPENTIQTKSVVKTEEDEKNKAEKFLGPQKFNTLQQLVALHKKLDTDKSTWAEIEKRIIRLCIFQLMANKHSKSTQDILKNIQELVLKELGMLPEKFSSEFQETMKNILLACKEETVTASKELTHDEALAFSQLLTKNSLYLPQDNSAYNYFAILQTHIDKQFQGKRPELQTIQSYQNNFLVKAKELQQKNSASLNKNAPTAAPKHLDTQEEQLAPKPL